VTARYLAENALKESEERFRALANNIPQLAWMANAEGWIFWYNQRWYDYTGTTPAAMEGWGWQAVHDPEVLPEVLQQWRAALESGTPFEMTFPLRSADGTFRPFLTRVSPLRDETGRIARWFGTNTDVTEQRQIEKALRASEERLQRLNETLEARVREEVAERERAQKELLQVQKLEAIGQLTGGIAHDFNNLLTAIIGNLEVLKAGPNTQKARRHIEAATRSAERGASLTQQLLAYARKQYLVSRAVDLNQLILNLDELLNRSLGGLIQVDMRLADGLWHTDSDPTQLEMAILNLAINARDAMPFGGSLCIETKNAASDDLLPADLPPGDYVYLQISDTGEGMTAEVLSKAMDPFFTTKDIGKGSGLGLSQVYGVVKQCGGTIRLESAPGRGTTVRIWLPRTHQVPVQVRRDESGVGSSGRGANVLVVDDDPDVRSITVEMLRDAGYALEEAESAERALDLLDRGLPVDVALVDYAMPRISGTQFVRAARERRPDLPVIYITGYAEPIGAAQESNAIILRKPYRTSDLLRAVETTVERQGRRLAVANVAPIRPASNTGAG
jgi:PAS domain S-box-containing protein